MRKLNRVFIFITVFSVFLTLLLIEFDFFPAQVKHSDTPRPQSTESLPHDWMVPNQLDSVRYTVRTQNGKLAFYEKGVWTEKFIFGMNLGATKPGLFPGDLSISYDDYFRWFTYMGDIGVNLVRVYTAQRPQFYTALYDYNQTVRDPIYLMHGVWVNEEDIGAYNDAYAQGEKIINGIIEDGRDIVDIIHGNGTLLVQSGYASGTYTTDISDYLAGWILGIEWAPYFVQGTNDNNPNRTFFRGNYFYTVNASPFEVFLCEVADSIATYQARNYALQCPIAFANWVTTDPITHPNNPHPDEDLVSVNVEHIKWNEQFMPGMFASYHAYPYYPDCFNYQQDYISYIDPYGKPNPYRAYLRDLKLAHSMPILIAEFGIPTSRAMAHENIHMGYNQGGVGEERQGEMLLDMMDAFYQEGYAGGIVFSWQDEWFKYTWNTQIADLPDRRAYWSNAQTNEQYFGLLAFDPGTDGRVCYVDGDVSEWNEEDVLLNQDGYGLSVKHDERNIYLMVELGPLDFDRDKLFIPVDTISDQGNNRYLDEDLSFARAADFVIALNGEKDTRVLVDANYDVFCFTYAEQLSMLPVDKENRQKDTGRFQPINLCLNYPMDIPDVPKDQAHVDIGYYETGKLVYGNGNPDAEDYNSLADFCYADGRVEIAIPWMLLNVMDPSSKQIVGNFYEMNRISPVDVESFYFGLAATGQRNVPMAAYTWAPWETPVYHERLKKSYYLLGVGMKAYLKK